MSIPRFLFRQFSQVLSVKNLYLIKSLSYRTSNQKLPANYDYIRYSSLGLVYEEIIKNSVKGNVAELGVYKGDFAKRLNKLFSDRKLYLFDTFKGFADSDGELDKSKGFSAANQDFSDTSIELVRAKMLYPDNCVFKPGVFPLTARDVNDSFCFVSLDADLYQPIYEGLKFFYPKVNKGGYIFIHDFNNDQYKGVKQAVIEFCRENGLPYVPIPDNGGTVIIPK